MHNARHRQGASEFLPTSGQGPNELLGEPWDVVVVGGGNAALVSALTAREHGRRVLLVEAAPLHLRGGNSRHTRNIRTVHDGSGRYMTGSYSFDELWRDLCGVGDGPSSERLAAQTVRESEALPPWMSAQGIAWQGALSGTLQLSRTNRFFLGGGKALVNTYYGRAHDVGVAVIFDAKVEEMGVDGNRCTSLVVNHAGHRYELVTKSVVCASGGFESNIEWLRRYWGDAVDNYIIRGTPYNDGSMLQVLFDHGALSAGQERGFHAIAVDARAPKFDGGIPTRMDTVPLGIVVNASVERFYDEGEDLWPKRYAIWGRKIAEQPSQIAYSLWDAKVAGCFLPPLFPPYVGSTVGGLAEALGLAPSKLEDTVREYNAAVVPGGTFDQTGLDDCHTEGLTPAKSHWAQAIDTPPFSGVPLRPGITFTYMGVAVDECARVLRQDGEAFANIFAAGEIMSGNILSSGYLAGFGMTIGSVWGRIAGREAARASD